MKKDPFQYIFRFCCDPGFNDAEEIPALLRYVDEADIDDAVSYTHLIMCEGLIHAVKDLRG